ncbi:hypothetical protein, partial [Mesorhizobium sp. M7D.F.Ca.US.004.03.1.1]|uniref:hypothetical protein n=1 Tax=Mesorhizobium sp. M7D.F.Ca.US.004.03.1.1 TaxID=2496702 RepID=UPI0019D08605
DRHVTLITAGRRAGHRLDEPNFVFAQRKLAMLDIDSVTDFVAERIAWNEIIGRNVFTQQPKTLGHFDAVVTVSPGRPLDRLSNQLENVAIRMVGDCVAPRNVEAAILEAHQLAATL